MEMYLVTGGAGFIGSHIVEELLRRGNRVRVLDNFATGKRENLCFDENFPLKPGQLEVIESDIRDLASVRRATSNVDYVLHQAALPSVPRSIADPVSTNDVNVAGTLNVLVAAKAAGVKRVVYASSSSVYGDGEASPKHEGLNPNPISPYAVSKLAGENYCEAFWSVYRLPTVALRYFNVFGPRQNPESQYAAVVPKFICRLLAGESPEIFGDGTTTRDFTYVSNVVEANIRACTSADAVGNAMNIACFESHSLNELSSILIEMTGSNLESIYSPARAGDIKHSLASIDLANQTMGYVPRIRFKEGLALSLKWYKTHCKR